MSAIQPPVLSLEHVTLQLGSTPVLQDISLTIQRGECIALVGVNGSGKSSLLRVMAGLVAFMPGLRKCGSLRVGFVFQRPWVMRMSVLNNVRWSLWLAGKSWHDSHEPAVACLKRVDLAHASGVAARTLSVGQQQRLALARALAQSPDLLLLDEPMASLDAASRQQVQEILRNQLEVGLTMVIASHQAEHVRHLATRVICLHEGRVLGDWPAEHFFAPDGVQDLPPLAKQFLLGVNL